MTTAQSNIAVTIYNNNIALVREVRPIQLDKGRQEFRFTDVAAQIDPTSVHFKSLNMPDGILLLEQNYEYDLIGTERLLTKYLDQGIVATTKEGKTFSGKLLNSQNNDIIMQTTEGIKVLKAAFVETIEFPQLPIGLITKPTLVWLMDCKKAGQHDAEISYLTNGLKWHTEYVAVTNEKDTELELSGWVSIENNSGATFNEAKLKLVAGDVNLAKTPPGPIRLERAMAMADVSYAPFEEKSFFEYHLYTLQRPATLADRQIKQVTLFAPSKVAVKKKFVFDPRQDESKVQVKLEFKNDQQSGLGMPLPKGKIRVYKKDDDGSQEFIGEDWIDHTPKDEQVRVDVGKAFDIVAQRIVKEQKEISKRVTQQTIQVELRNRKSEAVTISVFDYFYGDWDFVGPTPPVKKKDAEKVEFEVPIAADSEKTITYTVTLKR